MAGHEDPLIPDEATGRLPESARVRTFVIIIVTTLFAETAALQYTMVAPAAIRIAPSFPGVGASISWMTTIFGLVGGVVAPLVGKSSDLWGKKKMLIVSGVLFLIGSLVCCFTNSWAAFLIGRGLQALALGNTTVTYGVFRDILPRKYVPTAVGLLATGFGLSALAAPILSGYLLDHFSWRALFWFMTGYGAVTLIAVILIVPESPLRVRQRLDILGAVILSGGLTLCLLYLSEGHSWGWAEPTSLACLIGGLVLLACFVAVERRTAQPIIDLRLLLNSKMLFTLGATLCGAIVIGIFAYAMPLLLQTPTAAQLTDGVRSEAMEKQNLDSAAAALIDVGFNGSLAFAGGLTLISFALHAAVFQGGVGMAAGPWVGWLSGRKGPRTLLLGALVVYVIAGVLFLTTTTHGVWFYALAAGVFGLGFGAFLAIVPNLVMDAVPPQQQGVSTGMMNVFISLGSAIGAAVVTAIIYENPLIMTVSSGGKVVSTTNLAETASLTNWDGATAIYWAALIAAALGLVIALAMKHGRVPATGGAVSEETKPPAAASVAN
ncbi:MFS transporter [Streptomyces sp. NPDC002896]|uniref:MFS transporter n=1 Tax=Streptomyces sp. NPDC002896 TaxID=3154438 RepID=UPI003323036A